MQLSEADMEELSRRVASILARNSNCNLKRQFALTSESEDNARDAVTKFLFSERSLSVKFREEVPLMGLSDAIKSKHRLVKFFWVVVFLVCFAATSYFLYKIFDEYLHNPTATKVRIAFQN